MSLVKKIMILLIFFVILNVVSIYTFDYKSYLNDNTNFVSQTVPDESSGLSKIFKELKEKVFSSFFDKSTKEPSSIVLLKKDGVVELNGVFGNELLAKKVSDVLSSNREGDIDFQEDRVLDEVLLNKVAILVPTFKDFFADNSKLSIINNEVSLEGELKDSNYKGLLDSVISRLDFKLTTNVIVPKESTPSVVDENKMEKDITKVEPVVIPNTANQKTVQQNTPKTNKDELQKTINDLLAQNKITFERRGTKVVDSSISTIEKISKILKDNPKIKIEVSGHTDSRGKDSLNKQISQDRASSVKDILVGFGIDTNRISAVGYGEEKPIAKDDENGLSEINRRVEFNILGE